jgi:hypothetical protein
MALESHLYPDADTAEYAVDVSSVVHDTKLGGDRPADLGRFYALIVGLVAYAKNDDLRIYAVGDWSLVRDRRLTEKERSTLLRWHRRGRIELLDPADDRLLELADTTGQLVVSADYFRDYVPDFPWIAGNRDRFLLPVPDPSGVGVTVEPRVMPIPFESEISRKMEEHELLAMGLYDRRGRGGPRRDLLGSGAARSRTARCSGRRSASSSRCRASTTTPRTARSTSSCSKTSAACRGGCRSRCGWAAWCDAGS